MAWTNDPAEARTLESYTFSNTPAQAATLTGNAFVDVAPEERDLDLQPSQAIEGIDGNEDFENFAVEAPITSSPILTGFNSKRLIAANLTEYWTQDPLDLDSISNAQASVVVNTAGRKGILLAGKTKAGPDYYGDPSTDTDIGPASVWFPFDALLEWNVLRIGFLVAFRNTPSSSASPGQLAFGLSTLPEAKYRFRRFGIHVTWPSLAYNGGRTSWDSTGPGQLHSGFSAFTNSGDPDFTVGGYSDIFETVQTPYLRGIGNFDESVYPMFMEISKDGPTPDGAGGASIKAFVNTGSGSIPITRSNFEAQMQVSQDSLVHTGANYYTFGSSAADDVPGETWQSFNNINIESFCPGIWIDQVSYKVLS
jgi:hypothetical protein